MLRSEALPFPAGRFSVHIRNCSKQTDGSRHSTIGLSSSWKSLQGCCNIDLFLIFWPHTFWATSSIHKWVMFFVVWTFSHYVFHLGTPRRSDSSLTAPFQLGRSRDCWDPERSASSPGLPQPSMPRQLPCPIGMGIAEVPELCLPLSSSPGVGKGLAEETYVDEPRSSPTSPSKSLQLASVLLQGAIFRWEVSLWRRLQGCGWKQDRTESRGPLFYISGFYVIW